MSDAPNSQPPTNSPGKPDQALRQAIERAFDYRGDVTVRTTDGRTIEGYLFDRRADGDRPHVRLMPKDGGEKITLAYDQIAAIDLTGRDPAAGKSWETWVKKYVEKKTRGQSASLEPEKLE